MEKFSLYDLLSVLFPGVVFVFMLNAVRNLFGIFSSYKLTEEWELLIVLSVLFGTLIYVISFTLVSRWKWLYRTCGLYTSVTVLFNRIPLPEIVRHTLNLRANSWYGQTIYTSPTEYADLTDEERTFIDKRQDEFYDRMYYELDYAGKLDSAKTFQSFYLFFRNLFIATLLSIFVGLLLLLLHLLPFLHLALPEGKDAVALAVIFTIVLLGSVYIARWYRQRMVQKMYWYFYVHINAKN
jgi:hypothetical protein